MTIVHKPLFTDYIKSRIKKNRNFLGMFVGSTGSGKSYCSLRLAENLDGSFDINRVAFSAKEFMDIINSGTLKKGSVIIWEEIGIGMNSRNWQSLSNKMINFLMQSFRHQNLIVLMNCPDASFLDVSVRKLLHCIFETESIDHKEKVVVVKPKLIQVNQTTGKVYMKYLRLATSEGTIPFARLKLGLPTKKLVDEYEVKKKEFTQMLNKKIHTQLIKLEDDEKPKPLKELTYKQENVLKMLKEGMLIHEVAKELGLDKDTVNKHIQAVKKKGYGVRGIRGPDMRVNHYEISGFEENIVN